VGPEPCRWVYLSGADTAWLKLIVDIVIVYVRRLYRVQHVGRITVLFAL